MLVVSTVIIFIVIGVCRAGGSPVVTTPLGKIKGYYLESFAGTKYEAYEGVPYALPPIGDRRFEPPEPVKPWSDEVVADKFPEHCIGHSRETSKVYGAVDGVEDCLYLNVYVPPKKTNESFPVIIWIYGGAFQYSTLDKEQETYLMDHDVIFVSLNYRLASLGFLSTEDEVVPGNMGLKDQALAIKWVSENIEYFGGDPKRVTLTGLSAGGASVHYHYLSPMTAGLFHSGISFSGTAFECWPQAKNSRQKAFKLGELVNCPTNNTRQLVQCLKEKPVDSILMAQPYFMPWHLNEFTPFGPVVEKNSSNPFIDRSPIEIVSSGNAYNVPWITGVVSEEGIYPIGEIANNVTALQELNDNWESIAPHLLQYYYTIPEDQHANVARKIRNHYFGDKPINRENLSILIHLVSDRIFVVDSEKAARVQAAANQAPVWYYYYSYRAEGGSLSDPMTNTKENIGVSHADDVLLVLKNHFIHLKRDSKDFEMHKELIKLWISVARNGVPDIGHEWPTVEGNSSNLNYLHMAAPGLKDAELYYVREGIINTYAMNFVVPVAARIDDLEFTWQSLAGRPLAYSMKLDYEYMLGVPDYGSGLMALLPPKVNVSSRGFVPTSQQVFAIRLPCSGLESAEVMLSLKLNVTAPPESKYGDTILVFKRNKICIKGTRTQSKNDTVWLEPGPLTNGNGAFYVAATCACALIFVVVSVASTLYIRNSKARSQHPRKSLTCCSYSAAGTGGMAASSVLVKVDNRPGSANSGSYATIADLEPLYARPCGSRASYYAASHVTHLSQSTDPCEKARAVAVPRASLKCRGIVQEGTFGRVYRGSLSQAGREQEVIIKTVTDQASAYQASLLVVEGSQLAGMVHGNVASLTASSLEGTSPMLAYSSAPSEMNLKTYLTGGGHHPVTRDLVNVAVQVARAGAFLHGRGILHRDIAARNCLIDTRTLHARLADAALSRDLFPQDYHCLGDNENRAIGWMALETLQHGQYSTASDAWSFGVFLWELATMGQQPYLEVDPFELTAYLRDGYRLSQPRPCPDELFAVMAVCWLGPTRDRPTMPQLLAYLQEFHDALGGFI